MISLLINDECYNIKYVGLVLYYKSQNEEINYLLNSYMVNIHYNKNLNKVNSFCLGTNITVKNITVKNINETTSIQSNFDKLKICLINKIKKCLLKNYNYCKNTSQITKNTNTILPSDILQNDILPTINKKINKITLNKTNKYINYVINKSSMANFYFKVKISSEYANILINMCNIISIPKNFLISGIKKSPIYKKNTKINIDKKTIELCKREHFMFYHLLELGKEKINQEEVEKNII